MIEKRRRKKIMHETQYSLQFYWLAVSSNHQKLRWNTWKKPLNFNMDLNRHTTNKHKYMGHTKASNIGILSSNNKWQFITFHRRTYMWVVWSFVCFSLFDCVRMCLSIAIWHLSETKLGLGDFYGKNWYLLPHKAQPTVKT